METATGRTLSGRRALVTGAGRGLGRALALALARRGCDVVVHYFGSALGARETCEAVRGLGRTAALCPGDLETGEGRQAVVAALEGCDILVNSAALFLEDTAPDAVARQWRVNAEAPWVLSQAFAAQAAGGADLLNVVDVAGMSAWWRGYSAYCMSKAALVSLTYSLAVSGAPRLRVNAVAPGTVTPPPQLSHDALDALVRRIPAGRLGQAQEVADAAVLLLEGPRYLTGQVLAVDGGRQRAS